MGKKEIVGRWLPCLVWWGASDGDEHLAGELGNSPRGLGSPRAKHREKAEEVANAPRGILVVRSKRRRHCAWLGDGGRRHELTRAKAVVVACSRAQIGRHGHRASAAQGNGARWRGTPGRWW